MYAKMAAKLAMWGQGYAATKRFCRPIFQNFGFVFRGQTFYFDHSLGIVGPIDVKRKGSICNGCRDNYVIPNFDLTHELDLGFSRSNFKTAVSREWEGRLTWTIGDVS